MKYSIFLPLSLLICSYANADISSFFLDIEQMDRYGKQTRVDTLNAICNAKGEHDLVILRAIDKDGNINSQYLNQVQPYYKCFNKIFFSVNALKWQQTKNDWKDSQYYNGITDPNFTQENLEYSIENAKTIIKKYPKMDFGWYISYEANLNYIAIDKIKDGYKSYLKNLSNSLYDLKPTDILWSPAFWIPNNKISDPNKLVSNLHDLFKNTPRINWLHFQDFLGQTTLTTCNNISCNQSFNLSNRIFSNTKDECINTANNYSLLQQATKNTNIKNLKVTMELYTTKSANKNNFLPAPQNLISERIQCYKKYNIPIGISSELLYWGYINNPQ